MQYSIEEHGQVSGEDQMLAEIYARDPISCGMVVTEAFDQYSGRIYNDTTPNPGVS